MTCWRGIDQLNLEQFPVTAAEMIDGSYGGVTWPAITERAWYEWAKEQDAMEAAAQPGGYDSTAFEGTTP